MKWNRGGQESEMYCGIKSKRENSEKNPENSDFVHHKYHFVDTEIWARERMRGKPVNHLLVFYILCIQTYNKKIMRYFSQFYSSSFSQK